MSRACHVILPGLSFDLKAAVLATIERQDRAEALGIEASDLLSPPPSPSSCAALDNGDEDSDGSDLTPLNSDIDENVFPTGSHLASTCSTASSSNISKVARHKRKADKPKKPLSEHRRLRRNTQSSAAHSKSNHAQRNTIDGHQKPRKNLRKKRVANPTTVVCDIDLEKVPVAKTAFIGTNDTPGSRKAYKLHDLVGDGSKLSFKLQKWDGSTSIVLVDNCGRTIAILAGHPNDENWSAVQEQAAEALESRRTRCHIPKKQRGRAHRRGRFIALSCGVSHGGGQKEPGNLSNNPQNAKVLSELNSLECFKRFAGFASSVMATWTPELHEHYRKNMDALHERYPHLVRIFPSCIFSAASYNLGPRTVCFPHKDFANLPYGLCAITSLGDFDYKIGGHLVLWDLGLVIEFPPGSTILLPSATVAHSNIAVAEHEHRFSFAQYTAGALFRWVDNKFQTRENYLASLSPDELQADAEKEAQRWEYGLSLLPVYPIAKK